MKTLLVALNSKYSHTNIALYYLKRRIDDLCNCNTFNFNINDELNHIIEKIYSEKADLVCFGCYIWNIEYVVKIAKSLKIISPETIIAFGGPEVSYNPDEILYKYNFVSAVMCGESENSIIELVNDVKKNDIKRIYKIAVSSTDIPRIANDIIENYDNRVVYFETSRGCPFRCSYCLSCIDKNIKYFDMEEIKNDLKKLLDKDVKQIRFLDRTFNSDRNRAIEIWDFLVKNRKNTTFHFEICAYLIDEKTLEFLKLVPNDVFQFEIGIQSTNKETLEGINRHYHFDYEKEVLKELKRMNNIKLHTDLIIGLPYEDFKTFKTSFNILYEYKPHEIQIGFLKLLKGTDIYMSIKEHEYKFNEFPPYEILANKYISFEEIQYLKKLENIFEVVYNSSFFKHTLTILETLFKTPFELYEHLIKYYDKMKYFDRKISTDETFEILDTIFKNDSIYNNIKQALTYDYFLLFNGTREWMYKSNAYTKEYINDFIVNNRSKLFDNKNNSEIYKKYKFLILDYDFNTNTIKNTIYYTLK